MKNRNRKGLNTKVFTKKIVCIATSLGLVIGGWAIHYIETTAAYVVDKYSVRALSKVEDVSDMETLNDVENPGRGFYKGLRMQLTEKGDMLKENYDSSLLHFRVDISHFSPCFREKKGLSQLSDYHISKIALDALRARLKKCRDNHRSVIIRFAYDPKFSGVSYEPEKQINVDGNTYSVGDVDLINTHQKDLSVVLHEYKDVIVALEAGLIGPWGEMHSSDKMSYSYDSKKKELVKNPEQYNKIIGKWLELMSDTDIPVLIRKMQDYINFVNVNGFKDKDVKHENVGEFIPTAKMKEYNLGFFNDSYLGSTTDRGTFSKCQTRATAIKLLKGVTSHTLYGGEMAIWHVDKKNPDIKRYNTLGYITKEAFNTHTSYLNIGWNTDALNQLKGVYNKDKPDTMIDMDLLEDDKNAGNYDKNYEGQNGFIYLRNHLGYRYVARKIKLTKETTTYENFGIEAKIENVGFANITRGKKIKLIMEDKNGKIYEYPLSNVSNSKNEKVVNGDVRNWLSDDKSTKVNEGITTFKAQVDLKDDMPKGKYKVYLRISDNNESKGLNGYPVRFANKGKGTSRKKADDKGIWNETLGANYFGSFNVVDIVSIKK